MAGANVAYVTVRCVVIPSRADLRQSGSDLKDLSMIADSFEFGRSFASFRMTRIEIVAPPVRSDLT